MSSEMYVTKRDGQTEIVAFDKILRRIKRIGQEAGIKINYTTLAMRSSTNCTTTFLPQKLTNSPRTNAPPCRPFIMIMPPWQVTSPFQTTTRIRRPILQR